MISNNTSYAICKHRLLFGCKAYAEIPYEIAEGIEIHDKVRPDQKGRFIFELGDMEAPKP